jgi:hypothetical protein
MTIRIMHISLFSSFTPKYLLLTFKVTSSQIQSQSYFTIDGQSVCLGVEPTLGLVTRYYFLYEGFSLKVAVLSLWGAISDERTDL